MKLRNINRLGKLINFTYLKKRIKARFFKFISNTKHDRLFGVDLRNDKRLKLNKNALISYIVHPFKINPDDPRFLHHINIWRVNEIVRILNEMGYIVDVIDYQDIDFTPVKDYNLFIGHGGINFEKIANQLAEKTYKIYFSAGTHWKFWNQSELIRFNQLKKRKGFDLPLDRFIKNSEETALKLSNGIIALGNDFTRNTYKDYSNIIMINNVALLDNYYECFNKDFDVSRKYFLYYAGPGCVHKGLDLLLDTFTELDEHLWICCHIEEPFMKAYSKELNNYENIHLIGWVQPRSHEFYDLMSKCCFSILPSCAEAQAHSIVECMNQGLIPIVSKEVGLDVNDYGFMLHTCEIAEIRNLIMTASKLSSVICKEMSLKARNCAVTKHTEKEFSLNFAKTIQYFINAS